MMHYRPADLLLTLLEMAPRPMAQAPRDARGLYGLVDHLGDLRYIGSTKSLNQTLYYRLHHRHRTGSEDKSHYFSKMYNTGRMWRDQTDATTTADGKLAKKLRNEFVVDHCRAVWIALPDTADIARLEAEVIALAPSHAIAWNRRKMQTYDEPVELVDATLRRLGWGSQELAAIERQRQLFRGFITSPVPMIKPQLDRVTSRAHISAKASDVVKSPRAPSAPRGLEQRNPANPIRDAILQSMNTHTFFRPHPSETIVGGTKKVSAFLGKNGRVIALEKALATNQPMWSRDEPHLRALLDTLGVSFDGYPPERGKNSNLSKLTEFKGKALLRAFPSTAAEAFEIVNAVILDRPIS